MLNVGIRTAVFATFLVVITAIALATLIPAMFRRFAARPPLAIALFGSPRSFGFPFSWPRFRRPVLDWRFGRRSNFRFNWGEPQVAGQSGPIGSASFRQWSVRGGCCFARALDWHRGDFLRGRRNGLFSLLSFRWDLDAHFAG